MADRPKTLHCAVYTRKSSEEGLQQAYNSLHAQREACEAFILSQRHEGWVCLPAAYDDGGFSGGSMERPGLARLLDDVGSKKVDVVVVYKVDRLTRSLADFARIVDVFDKRGVSFVSVTQQFNTTSSMGRLTLNVLLSFAQFEREVTGERIRDKIAASKKKGMWMGGWVPLGYDREGRSLKINPIEAETVKTIFRRYLDLGNVRLLQAELECRGFRTKAYTTVTGRKVGALRFSRGHLYKILTNPIYVGEIEHRGTRSRALHAPIIDRSQWDAVAAQLAAGRQGVRTGARAASASLLAGMIFDQEGRRLISSHAVKDGKRYRYYVTALEKGASVERTRIPAGELDAAVLRRLVSYFEDAQRVIDLLRQADCNPASDTLKRAAALAAQLGSASTPDCRALLLDLVERIDLGPGNLRITARSAAVLNRLGVADQESVSTMTPEPLILSAPIAIRGRGGDAKLVLANDPQQPRIDPALIKAIARGAAWMEELTHGRSQSIAEIAHREGVSDRYVSQILNLAFLSPAIVTAALAGSLPSNVTAKRLTLDVKLPHLWREQEVLVGLSRN